MRRIWFLFLTAPWFELDGKYFVVFRLLALVLAVDVRAYADKRWRATTSRPCIDDCNILRIEGIHLGCVYSCHISRSLPWLISFGSWIAQALPVVVPGEPDEGTDYTCFVEDSICIE